MKAKVLAALLLTLVSAAAQDEAAANVSKTEALANPLLPNQQAFLNLPEESRNEFIKHLTEANRLFQQKRVFETLDEIAKASKIFDDSPEIYNIRGSCYVEFRAFDKALKDFEKAQSYSKDNPSLEFNVAEIFFVTKEWKKAAALYDKILKLLPPNNPQAIALGRLSEFKLMLCKIKLGLHDEAVILSEKYDFLDDSPYYYYAQAALAYEAQDLIKAEEWLAISSRVFPDPNILAPWQDTLVEYGYIKSFYGEEAGSVGDASDPAAASPRAQGE